MNQFEKIPINQPEDKAEEKETAEREQTPEEIFEILKNAIESEKELGLSVLSSKGEIQKGIIVPEKIDGNVVWITDKNGVGSTIELSRIKKAESALREEK